MLTKRGNQLEKKAPVIGWMLVKVPIKLPILVHSNIQKNKTFHVLSNHTKPRNSTFNSCSNVLLITQTDPLHYANLWSTIIKTVRDRD